MKSKKRLLEFEYIPLKPETMIPTPLLHRLRSWLREELRLRPKVRRVRRERVIRF